MYVRVRVYKEYCFLCLAVLVVPWYRLHWGWHPPSSKTVLTAQSERWRAPERRYRLRPSRSAVSGNHSPSPVGAPPNHIRPSSDHAGGHPRGSGPPHSPGPHNLIITAIVKSAQNYDHNVRRQGRRWWIALCWRSMCTVFVRTNILYFLITERLKGDADHLSIRIYYGPTTVACNAIVKQTNKQTKRARAE